MGDASMSPEMPQQQVNLNPQGEQMPQDPNMANGDTSMGADPNMMGGDPGMAGTDPNMAGGDSIANLSKEREQIQKNIGKACADYRSYLGQDKEELGKWISGMLDSLDGEDDENVDFDDNAEGGDMEDGNVGPEDPNMEEMPMESVIVSKKQLKEIFNQMDDDKKEVKPQEKQQKVKNSPFNNPNFQK